MDWISFSKLGQRRAILNDLSPAATFIAYNYNSPVNVQSFEREANRILKEVEGECSWMYETIHTDERIKGKINYTVWSDVFVCPECTSEVVFWEVGVDKEVGKINSEFPCPHCDASLTKRNMNRVWVNNFDNLISQTIRQAKQVPVIVNYSVDKTRYESSPDAFDLSLLKKIQSLDIPYWFPTNRMPKGFNTEQPKVSHGFTHVHHFYFKRTLWTLSELSYRFSQVKARRLLNLLFTSQLINISKMNRYRPGVSFPYNPMSGTLYVGSQICESNPFIAYRNKVKKFIIAKRQSFILDSVSISTASTSQIEKHIPAESIDYMYLPTHHLADNLPCIPN